MKNHDREIEKTRSFRWWKRCQRRNHLRFFLYIVILLVIVALVVMNGGFQTETLGDALFGIVLLVFFVCYALYKLWMYFSSFFWRVDNYWYGTVKDMYTIRQISRRRVRDRWIVANVNGKEMEGLCLTKTYNRAEIGDRVILFTIGKDTVYCVHRDM